MEEAQSNETNGTKIPFVSVETKNQMFADMGLTNTGEDVSQWPATLNKVDSVSRQVLSEFAQVNPNLLSGISSLVETQMYPNSYAIGMSLVLRAMHIQSDFKLLYQLGELSPESMDKMLSIMKEGLPKTYENMFQEALSAPTIPVTQENLREVINVPTKKHPHAFDSRYTRGAAVMYKALESIWGSLDTARPPSSESSSTPSDFPPPNPTDSQ